MGEAMTASKSGLSLTSADIPIVLGMAARDDRNHDIAAWFGVNQGRVAEAKKGEYGTPAIAPSHDLPPKGPPGIKGRRLRETLQEAISLLGKGGVSDVALAKAVLEEAAKQYDADEI